MNYYLYSINMQPTILKKGDRVKVTTDPNVLNRFMEVHQGKEAIVTELCSINHRQLVKIDIDNGLWTWEFEGKLNQIEKI